MSYIRGAFRKSRGEVYFSGKKRIYCAIMVVESCFNVFFVQINAFFLRPENKY